MLKFPSIRLRNLVLALDCHLSMNAHVSNIARTCYFELRRLASIWHLHPPLAIIPSCIDDAMDY